MLSTETTSSILILDFKAEKSQKLCCTKHRREPGPPNIPLLFGADNEHRIYHQLGQQ